MILSLLSTEAPAQPPPDLGERMRRRDRGAWDRLVADEHGRLFNLHLRLTGDREAAADLTQDTFVEGWRGAELRRGSLEGGRRSARQACTREASPRQSRTRRQRVRRGRQSTRRRRAAR